MNKLNIYRNMIVPRHVISARLLQNRDKELA